MNLADRDSQRLQKMISYCIEVQRDRAGISSPEDFPQRTVLARAIMFDFIQLGEEAGQFSEAFYRNHPDFQVSAIKGFRNVIVHDYAGLVAKSVDETVHRGIDLLLVQLTSYL
jgi:uncharacterized protein with HEPN domain